MSEKILTTMKNLWENLKKPYKNLYAILFFSLSPNIIFISRLIFDLHWSVSLIGFFSFIPLYFHMYKYEWDFFRNIFYKNDIFVYCMSNKPYWEKLDKKFTSDGDDSNSVKVNLMEIYDHYPVYSKGLENYNLRNNKKYLKSNKIIVHTDDIIFKINNREELITDLLNGK